MDKHIEKIFQGLILVFLIISNTAVANTDEMDKAIKMYYGGFPARAISLIRPLALAGDVDAQFLLGNIFYSLSKNKKFNIKNEPVKWYEMAAEQNSPGANYALGVIYQNRWVKSHRMDEVAIAISYYEKAVELGYEEAQIPLRKIKFRGENANKRKPFPEPDLASGILKQASQIPVEKNVNEPATVKLANVEKESTTENSGTESNTANLASVDKQSTDEDSASVPGGVTLADLANQCRNYTRAGFNYYAESIKGQFLEGNATVEAIRSTSSKRGTYLVNLISTQFSAEILLALYNVPKEAAAGLEEGLDFRFAGIVENSKMDGSNCEVNLIYRS